MLKLKHRLITEWDIQTDSEKTVREDIWMISVMIFPITAQQTENMQRINPSDLLKAHIIQQVPLRQRYRQVFCG